MCWFSSIVCNLHSMYVCMYDEQDFSICMYVFSCINLCIYTQCMYVCMYAC